MDALLQQIATYLATLADWIRNYVAGIIQSATSFIGQLTSFIATAIRGVMDALTTWLTTFMQNLRTFFVDVFNAIVGQLKAFWDAAVGGIVSIIDKVVSWLGEVKGYLQSLFATAISELSAFVAGITSEVKRLLGEAIGAISDLAKGVIDAVKDGIKAAVGVVETIVQAIVQKVAQAIDQIVGASSALIAGVNARLVDVKQSFADAATRLVGALTGIAEAQLAPIRKLVEQQVGLFLDATGSKGMAEMSAVFADYTSPRTLHLASREEAARLWNSLAPTTVFTRWLFLLVSNVMVFWATFAGVGNAAGAVVLQEYALTYPHQILSPADAATAYRKGIMAIDQAMLVIRKAGYSPEDASRILSITEQLPAPGDILTMMHRGLVSEAEARQALRVHGIEGAWATRLMEASNVIPPLQDIITMAVREVFTPAVTERFGQFEDYPPELTKWAKANGLSESWARNYWAAHWSLPSATQGFEMVHRGAIRDEDLDLLLRSLDVMPFWREPLKAITYLPLTRVDIRRMHKIGVLDRAAVKRAHLDLGYNEDRAELLTDFVVKLNAAEEEEEAGELGKITRENVLGFYRDGTIDRAKALELLSGLGITQDAAALYVQGVDLDIARESRRRAIQLVSDRFAAGAITEQEAEQQLVALNLTSREVSRAIEGLELRKAAGTKLPTRSEAERMVKAGQLDGEGYVELLGRLGYAPVWARRFLAILEGGSDA